MTAVETDDERTISQKSVEQSQLTVLVGKHERGENITRLWSPCTDLSSGQSFDESVIGGGKSDPETSSHSI